MRARPVPFRISIPVVTGFAGFLIACDSDKGTPPSEPIASASASAALPPGFPPSRFAKAFVQYVSRVHRSPGRGGTGQDRPQCRENPKTGCELTAVIDDVPLATRWQPQQPRTMRAATTAKLPKALGLGCGTLMPKAVEVGKWSTGTGNAEVRRILCRIDGVPAMQGLHLLSEEAPDGTMLFGFYAQHLTWDVEFARIVHSGVPADHATWKISSTPVPPPQPSGSASSG